MPMCLGLLNRIYQLMPLQKHLGIMLDQIDRNCPTLDARSICSEIENLGEVCKETVKHELKGKHISITTHH